jgi:hypothetical protein
VKDGEGGMESAIGNITADPGHQSKGKAKQVQVSAMNVAKYCEHAAQSVSQKVSNTT